MLRGMLLLFIGYSREIPDHDLQDGTRGAGFCLGWVLSVADALARVKQGAELANAIREMDRTLAEELLLLGLADELSECHSPRETYGIAFDTARGRVVLHGGRIVQAGIGAADTWTRARDRPPVNCCCGCDRGCGPVHSHLTIHAL